MSKEIYAMKFTVSLAKVNPKKNVQTTTNEFGSNTLR